MTGTGSIQYGESSIKEKIGKILEKAWPFKKVPEEWGVTIRIPKIKLLEVLCPFSGKERKQYIPIIPPHQTVVTTFLK